jgi:hypothetical protein
MSGHILSETLRAVVWLAMAFALWKGDRAVRVAAVAILLVDVATFLIRPKFGDISGETILLAVDFACAVVLLLLAVRYANLWIGAAMLFQAAQFSVHAYYLVMERPHDRLHAWINNLDLLGIVVSIVSGTVLAIRRRVILAAEDAELEARRQKLSQGQ